MEREILKYMPPGSLNMITVQRRDVDGIAAVEVGEDPEKPDMVQVTSYFTPGTKCSGDWEVLSSAQLLFIWPCHVLRGWRSRIANDDGCSNGPTPKVDQYLLRTISTRSSGHADD